MDEILKNSMKASKDWVRVAAEKDKKINELKKELKRGDIAIKACVDLHDCIFASPKFFTVAERVQQLGRVFKERT